MAKNLLIVESPAKSKTIKKYLGDDFEVLATYGHMRDLQPKKGSVDPAHQFAMNYAVLENSQRHIDAISKVLKKAKTLYLATDPDREGEAISWHLAEILKERGLLDSKQVYRVVFNEITKSAILDAVEHPREISMDMVNAQQARRALDYLVGFNLSPLLWRKIRRGLSAGRVQSPALRLIVEREEEIERFVSQEFWTITADCLADKAGMQARLSLYNQTKMTQFSVTNGEDAEKIKADLLAKANGKLIVENVEKKQRKRNPAAPFITSTLQQEAARKLGFTAKRTMRVAQQLYEGVDIGTGTVGLISYMRTDSVNLANEAIEEIREFIEKRFGKENLPDEPKVYKTKSKNAQEAHEAIRPTSVKRTPEMVKDSLSLDQYKLYDLIWKRTVACQMIHATIDTVAIDLSAGEGNVFRATGSTIRTPGFISVYQEGKDDVPTDDEEGTLLPPVQKGDAITLVDILNGQHFTEPPPRYSEASLVKALEEFGIGRPSTYATIIDTLQQREYVTLDKKRFQPTDTGRVVNRFLTEYFTQYVDYRFTANLEDKLDEVARGEKQWIPLLEEFWTPFNELIAKIDKSVQRKDVTTEEMDEDCPKCGKKLAKRLGRGGRFIGCTTFPDCDYTRNLDNSSQPESEVVEDRECPECKSTLVYRNSRYGKFIGCSSYPTCTYIEPLEKPTETGVTCPVCKKGDMLQRRSKRGKVFFSCSKYPECKYATWNQPLNEPCPNCSWPILTLKIAKQGNKKVCPQKECGHQEDAD